MKVKVRMSYQVGDVLEAYRPQESVYLESETGSGGGVSMSVELPTSNKKVSVRRRLFNIFCKIPS